MRKEIGSEFWQVPTGGTNTVLRQDTQWFVSGRSALTAIIRDAHIKTVSLPDWCCESMIKPFIDEGVEVVFYPAFEDVFPDTDALLVMDYFGYTRKRNIHTFSKTVIRDVTHSLLSSAYDDAHYYFGSLRKWAGFFTGGFACGFKSPVTYENNSTDFVSLRTRAMDEKKLYISTKTDDKNYLDTFSRAEHLLDDIGVAPAHPQDVERAYTFDVSEVKRKRRSNAQILLNNLSDLAIFPDLNESDCPLFVPICIKNRDKLRQFLLQKEIYCPIHWPISKYHTDISKGTQTIYNEELSLVCDQRYDENDMYRIVDAIEEFLSKENI